MDGGGGVLQLDMGAIWRIGRYLNRRVIDEGVCSGFDLLDEGRLNHAAPATSLRC